MCILDIRAFMNLEPSGYIHHIDLQGLHPTKDWRTCFGVLKQFRLNYPLKHPAALVHLLFCRWCISILLSCFGRRCHFRDIWFIWISILSVYTVYCIMNGPLEMPKIPPRPSQNAQDLIRGLIKAGVSRVCWVKCGTPELVTGYQFICFDPYTVACYYSIIFNLRRKPWIFKSAPKVWNRLDICAMRHVTYICVFCAFCLSGKTARTA